MQGGAALKTVKTAFFIAALAIICLSWPQAPYAKTVEYKLTIAQKTVNLTGRPAQAMTINHGIPGPVLRFTEGDVARIQVHNAMDVSTSIHWHGILVPPGMDGVPNISFPPIAPGATFTYTFPIRQSGTYWYHSHSNLQEQSGVYGAIVIQPRHPHKMADREHVVVLSDWTDQDPAWVMHDLKRGSEYFGIQKGSAQSILGAVKLGNLGDYYKRELLRMPPMDIADVAYDRFLANGRPRIQLAAASGETVRLRIINGSSTTFFYLEFAAGDMTIISADGQEVEPVKARRLLIGVAETYDLLLTMPAQGSYELKASAQDGSSYSYIWLGTGAKHQAPDIPRPNLYRIMGEITLARVMALSPAGSMGMPDSKVEAGAFDQPGMAGMAGMGGMESMKDMGGMAGMKQKAPAHDAAQAGSDHSGQHADNATKMGAMPSAASATGGHAAGMAMAPPPDGKRFSYDFRPLVSDVASSPSLARDGGPERPWPPYDQLRAKHPTAYDPAQPRRIIRLTLDGDMERYVWLLNNKVLSEEDDIVIKKGEVVRFIMINRTMMHHPMHLHGHFFRVINKQGDYAPLKHTVDVAPMSTTVIEFAASEKGDWFFHCHLLYHMKAGMARMVHYKDYIPSPAVQAVRPNLYSDPFYFQVNADVLSNMTEGFLRVSNTRHLLTADWEAGWQRMEETEWEAIFTWDYYLDRFKSVFIGADNLGANSKLEKTRGVGGLRYLLPFNIESRTWLDTDLGLRITLDKEFMLTPRLALFGEYQYDTHDFWEAEGGVTYLINGNVKIMAKWHSEYGWGGGLQVSF